MVVLVGVVAREEWYGWKSGWGGSVKNWEMKKIHTKNLCDFCLSHMWC